MAGKQSIATVVKTATSLTDAYSGGWASDWHDVGTGSEATFLLTLVKDGATTVEFVVEVEDSVGTTGYQRTRVGTDGAAAIDQGQFTCAALDTTHYPAVTVDVRDAVRVRLKAKRTGGDSGTTLAASIMVGSQR